MAGLKGLLAVLAKPKGDEDREPPSSDVDADADSSSSEEQYADTAFDALKDGDKDAFRDAFIGAIKACIASSKSGGYDDEE